MIDALHDEVEKGTLSLEEAQEKVILAILGPEDSQGVRQMNKNINLRDNGYLFIVDENGVEIASVQTENKNLWDLEDANGNKFIQDIIEAGKAGGGLTYYEWPLPNDENGACSS